MFSDLRIPVVFGDLAQAGPQDAVLAEGVAPRREGATAAFTPGTGHAPGCTCCAPRGEAARALAWLLHARARNQVPYFTRVVAVTTTDAARADLCSALVSDPIASTCFRT
jgi:hypothetical protein